MYSAAPLHLADGLADFANGAVHILNGFIGMLTQRVQLVGKPFNLRSLRRKHGIGVIEHSTVGSSASHVVSYDVSVKVGDAIYMVVYTPPLGEPNVKYAAGRDLLVLVGKDTITYNDILGRSFAVPIESQKSAANPKQSNQFRQPHVNR